MPKSKPSKKITGYCRKCGKKMNITKVGKENILIYAGDDCFRLGDSPIYNSKTGKREWAYRYVCPNKKSGFWGIFSNHTDLVTDCPQRDLS